MQRRPLIESDGEDGRSALSKKRTAGEAGAPYYALYKRSFVVVPFSLKIKTVGSDNVIHTETRNDT